MTCLSSAVAEHLILDSRIHLAAEHELLAIHYLSVIMIIQKAAKGYLGRYEGHEDERYKQKVALAEYDRKAAAHRAYEDKSFLLRWFSAEPERPSGERPKVADSIADPTTWMRELIRHPAQLDQVIILDAGGLSLDIAVMEGGRLVSALSCSDTTCGGEAISREIGDHKIGDSGTRYKANLGLQWRQNPDSRDVAQQCEYREVSTRLYRQALASLFTRLAERWENAPACCVLLTGGGSRNPHLGDYIAEALGSVHLQATVVDAFLLQNLIQEARAFPEPLADLDSPTILRFEETLGWSKRREQQELVRYDRFAVIGGMYASTEMAAI